MLRAFIFVSHFLNLYKEQKKPSVLSCFLYITNFLSISLFAFTFKRRLCEKTFLKTTLCHIVCHVYVVKQCCGNIPNKISLKT